MRGRSINIHPMPPSFKDRKAQETLVGRKRAKSVKFQDAERRKCSKLVSPDTMKLTKLIASVMEKSAGGSIGSFEMWMLQLQLCKEMVLVASSLLQFLEQVMELEELASDAKTDIIPFIDSMIEECQDLIIDAESRPGGVWEAVAARDEATKRFLDKVLDSMAKVVTMVFSSKRWIKTEERFSLLNACCSLFEATEDLLNSVTYCGEFLELDTELEALIGDAISKCDDQGLDGYLDVDCENEEEEEEEDEDEDDFDDEEDEDEDDE